MRFLFLIFLICIFPSVYADDGALIPLVTIFL